jgi:CheY-like chemotaxis protein
MEEGTMVNQTDRYPQILIVEDDPSIDSLLEFILREQDHWNTTSVVNGRHAVEAWQSGNYDVILMDVRMPAIDGIDATKKIREKERESGRKRTPIIGFTAYVSKKTCQECLDADMDDFISKPTKIKTLVETVEKHLPDFFSPLSG